MHEQNIKIDGLKESAEITVDKWGIPHLRANSLDDLFFLQGFNAARDRLWQIDLWRKRWLGLLAADLGPGFLAQDRASRLFLYRGDMEAEWASYATDAREICTAFAAGINAYVTLTGREPERLPEEFRLLGTKPAYWQAEDVVRVRSHSLSRNALSEIRRAFIIARTDPATDLLRKNLEPSVTPHVAEGLDLAAIPLHALDVYELATASVTITPERLAASLADVQAWGKVAGLNTETDGDAASQGSNSWAVHRSRTDTGRPILASDPHRTCSLPSLRYLIHLTAPGFDAIGSGEPALPGIANGHNGHGAFGLTLFPADQEDVYVYETKPGDADMYRYGQDWEAMTLKEERFAVKGEEDQRLTLKFTRHGPVVFEDPARRLAIAIRSVWSEPGAAPYLASLAGMRTKSFDEFRQAMRRWGTPTINHVYADTSGDIGWFPAGYIPVRHNWNGLLPVPGDGRYEWDGFLDPDLMPRVTNPSSGFVATANEFNLPPDWPHDTRPVGFEWPDNGRAGRIHEVLSGGDLHGIAASCALQTDTESLPARRIVGLLAKLEAGSADEALGLELLRGWNGDLTVDSARAALFELWRVKHLKPALIDRLVSDDATRALLLATGRSTNITTIMDVLDRPDRRFGADPERDRDMLLRETLAAAVRDCRERLGAQPEQWAWGDLHHGYFEHALSALATQAGGKSYDIGPLPVGGSYATVMCLDYRESDFRVTHGASVRLVIDVGDWDNSLCINTPGQSGDPRSPHYGDLARLWAKGEYVPLLYSRQAVDEAAHLLIHLTPTKS